MVDIPIQEKEREITLEYDIGRTVLEGEVEITYLADPSKEVGSEERHRTYQKKLQALADIHARFTFRQHGSKSPPSNATIQIIDDLTDLGDYCKTGEEEGITCRKIGVNHAAANEHHDLSEKISGILQDRVNGYAPEVNITFHSVDLVHGINPAYQKDLVQPYVDALVDRAASDAKRLLGGVKT